MRLYVDIDAVDGGDGRQPSSKRLSGDIVRKHKFSGTATEQLVEVAKLWVDAVAISFLASRRQLLVCSG